MKPWLKQKLYFVYVFIIEYIAGNHHFDNIIEDEHLMNHTYNTHDTKPDNTSFDLGQIIQLDILALNPIRQ